MPNPYAQDVFWMIQKELLGDEAQVEARFSPFEESANFDARKVHGLC
jgi:hypothetical protein